MVAGTIKAYGRLDVAFNNAGIDHFAPLSKVEEADLKRVLDINVGGVLFGMEHEIPAMLESGGGSIINTSSIVGHVGMAGASTYVASKHAVEGLTKSVAPEFSGQGIRVNAVAPGGIATDMADRAFGEEGSDAREGIAAMHPLGRPGNPEKIAAAVLFLASEGAGF